MLTVIMPMSHDTVTWSNSDWHVIKFRTDYVIKSKKTIEVYQTLLPTRVWGLGTRLAKAKSSWTISMEAEIHFPTFSLICAFSHAESVFCQWRVYSGQHTEIMFPHAGNNFACGEHIPHHTIA